MRRQARTQSQPESEEVTAQYFIGGAKIGDKIRIGFGVEATLRSQYDKTSRGGDAGIELVVEDLILEIRSSDTIESCSLFSFGDRFFNIRGDGYNIRDGGTFLRYVIGITDPETSPCRGHCVQRDPGIRLD